MSRRDHGGVDVLDSFNQCLAQDLGPYGITIVAPGMVETGCDP
ncbi:hypothetical protein [Halomonas halmophila]|uniref:Uncharacterized protein n=1 Tax=Halomonas halmophila TaxID=252 RepID=A0A4Y4F877_9GAMM|nr:hypothetical protein [Halomonas halmophila]GED23830.1 hypothetical protein HHA01_28070 [Halomonas halmophila]